MRLRIAEGQDIGRILALGPDGVRIGRGQDNDLALPEEGVSRRHCHIRLADGVWIVEDLNSTNGVTVNGQRIGGVCNLAHGDRIGVGKHLLIVEADAAVDGPASPEALTLPPTTVPAPAPSPPLALRAAVTPEAPVPVATATRAEPLWDDAELPPRRRIPWVRLGLLVLLVVVIAVLAFLIFGGSPAPAAAGTQAAGTTTPGAPASVPKEVSDAELASLIAAEEKAGPRTGTPTPATRTPADTAAATPPAGTAPEVEDGAPVAETGRAVVSDLVFVATDPPGATVLVDGAEKGTAPLLVRDVARGRHRIVLKLAGYEDFERQIHVPDLLPSRPYALRARPGTLYVSSSVPGTAIWRGPQLLGVAPVLLQDLPPASYDLTFAAPGCEPLRKAVTLSEVSSERVDVEPRPLLGALELTTQPAGCAIALEGGLVALSQPAGDQAVTSLPLRFDRLCAGTYTVTVEHPLGGSRTGRLTVKAGETATQMVHLWVPDSRVTLNDGTAKTGMIVERNEQGDIVLEERPRQLQRYLKPQVTQTVPLTKEETTEILKKAGLLPAPRTEARPDDKTDPKDKRREGADRRGPDAKGAAEATAPEAWGDAPAGDARPERAGAGDGAEPYTAARLLDLLRDEPGIEVMRRLKDRRITLRGRPTSLGKDKDTGDAYLAYDRRLRCYLGRGYDEPAREALRQAVEAGADLLVTGGQASLRAEVLVIRDCEAKPLPKGEGK